MPIHTKIIEKLSKTKDFPKLMQNKHSKNYIAVFTSPTEGFVIQEGDSGNKFGTHYDTFALDHWENFDGILQLSNGTIE